MSEKKRYAAVKKVNLEGFSEEWDASCYAYVAPATYDDNQALADKAFAAKSDADKLQHQKDFVKSHFISGRIKIFDGDSFVDDAMTVDDVFASVEITDYLYSEMMGLGIDPKDIRKVAMPDTLPTNATASTETTSQTE